MIEASARRLIARASDSKRLTFVLAWTVRSNVESAPAAGSTRAKKIAARSAYSEIKREVVDELRRSGKFDLQDLPGTRTVIATATPSVWRGIAPLLQKRRDVSVRANSIVATVPAVVEEVAA